MNIGLIIAGGKGARMHQDIPKQFLTVHEKPVIVYTMEAFERHPNIDEIYVVCIEGWEHVLAAYAKQFKITKLKGIIPGGDTGFESIRNGIFTLKEDHDDEDIVLVHDAIRPMVSEEIISECIFTAQQFGNGVTTIPCAEAMLITEDGTTSNSSFLRDNLKREQTPQTFKLGLLYSLHKKAQEQGITNAITSSSLAVTLGETIHFVNGSEKNLKLTTVDDLDIFRALLLLKKD